MSKSKKSNGFDIDSLFDFYDRMNEDNRLAIGSGPLELARTQEILVRYFPSPPAVVCDVGGGSGIYACWLARKGYEVHLVDPVAKHIQQAEHASRNQPDFPLARVVVGDARKLEMKDASVDAVLLFGPLYHLTKREDRLAALNEASRVTRKGGRIFASVISRFASLMDGIFRRFLDDPAFSPIVEKDLIDGQHRNPTGNPAYFTSTYFHHPDEIASEIKESGLILEKILPIESIGGLLSHFDETWKDDKRRERLLRFIRAIEDEPSLLGTSAHIMAIAKKGA